MRAKYTRRIRVHVYEYTYSLWTLCTTSRRSLLTVDTGGVLWTQRDNIWDTSAPFPEKRSANGVYMCTRACICVYACMCTQIGIHVYATCTRRIRVYAQPFPIRSWQSCMPRAVSPVRVSNLHSKWHAATRVGGYFGRRIFVLQIGAENPPPGIVLRNPGHFLLPWVGG